jgi:hypothetical protein
MAETEEEREFLLYMFDAIKHDLFDNRYRDLDLANDEHINVHLLRVYDDLQFLLENKKEMKKEEVKEEKMFSFFIKANILNNQGIEIVFTNSGKEMTFRELFFFMKDQPVKFHLLLKEAVLSLDYPAVYLEFPKLSDLKLSTRNTCVIIKAPELVNTRSDPEAFNIDCKDKVCKIENLSKDAFLIIPNLESTNDYGHLYKFLMNCNDEQEIRLFWKTSAETIFRQLDIWGNIWISTSGLGIPWLHLRISRTPKYYHFKSYTV